jgi:hypothetical protein
MTKSLTILQLNAAHRELTSKSVDQEHARCGNTQGDESRWRSFGGKNWFTSTRLTTFALSRIVTIHKKVGVTNR